MKSIFITICIAFLSLVATSQTQTLTSFWGIPFGLSKKASSMLKKGAKIEVKDANTLVCWGCEFGAFPADIILNYTDSDRLAMGYVIVRPDKKELVFELYDRVVNNLSVKYEKPTHTKERFMAPYENDGRKYPTLSVPTCTVESTWEFIGFVDPKMVSEISVEINRDGYVSITYYDGALMKDLVRNRRQKQQSDY